MGRKRWPPCWRGSPTPAPALLNWTSPWLTPSPTSPGSTSSVSCPSYRAGISGGGCLAAGQVDSAIRQFFGPVEYTHQSTALFPLTEDGYRPGCGGYSGGEYALDSLTFLPDGSFEAVLEESTQNLVITLALSPQDGSLRFHSVDIAQAQ